MTQKELYGYLIEAKNEYYAMLNYAKCAKQKAEKERYEQQAEIIETRVRGLFQACPEAAEIADNSNYLSPHYFCSDLSRLIDELKRRLKICK